MSDDRTGVPAADASPATRDLPPAAQRALAEAEERRKARAAQILPKEYGGRDGPEPVRYGDYEKNGIAVDF
ncbi:DUF1674 domain-containing protein [Paracoccus bogoriensis]|uniref:DUF1674 domain-containing protein n=1 Tax=Paracoccus bogoriensis TaxID=242065 RepID=UPI001CA5D877|nr:DUF1674 domain-containing protein [Paracoccus bogoriensis]MBW7056157.1 DUF1674 domain-containing protein [Paracoccus bogoriensis]